jgi:hypothetical protein
MSKAKQLIFSFAFVMIAFVFHFSINSLLPKHALSFDKIGKIHGFIFFITLIVLFLSIKIHKISPDKVGFGYLGLILVKMTFSIFFLFPHFSIKTIETKIFIINFFAVFFLYLVFEVITLLRLIKTTL